MKKWAKRTAMALPIIFLAMQVVRPAKTNPSIPPERAMHAQIEVPPEVAQIFERSCRDCHTSETRWPWYSHVAPVSWLVIDDVNEGRRHFNLSDWARYKPEKAVEKLGEVCENVSMGDMPLKSYLWMHGDAKLSPQDVKTLCEWSDAAKQKMAKK